MKTSTLENNELKSAGVKLARLSGAHGYRIEGDTAHLNAMFALIDPAAHEQSWALQLWACPNTPTSANDLAGHVVAEAALPPMGEIADETERFDVSAFALAPAGAGDYAMALVLASGRTGQFNQIHDIAVYPRREAFIQPRMTGNVGYRIEGARVQISVEGVSNPRPATNMSGTLSLELWALPEPFAGGRFQGQHLAGVEIGSLNGQNGRTLEPIDLNFTTPAAGTWKLGLMLREWTANGFVTRDFTNFATSYISAPVVEKTLALVVVKAPAPAVAKAPAREAMKTDAVVVPVKPAATVPAPVPPKGVSVNTARVEELAAVEGLSAKLAEGIVKKRPFASLEDLRRVKGLGEKILAKVRAKLRL